VPFDALVKVHFLDLSNNQITDLFPIGNLPAIETLNLYENQIIHIQPLLEVAGLGEEDSVSLWFNPIDCESEADAIQALRDRGVKIEVQCP